MTLATVITQTGQVAYERVLRHRLPRKIALCNGVLAYYPRVLDRTAHLPDIESHLVDAVHRAVETGDTVVEIGGGFGITTVHAAESVGEGGAVFTYDAHAKRVDYIATAARINGVADRVEVRHATVGPAIDTKGNSERIPATDLPECDALVLDCEGAESTVVREIDHLPRSIVVEFHPELAADSRPEFESLLENRGYDVADCGSDGLNEYLIATR
ncbi:MAG: protein-L-isoaspartate(D-aspartate) O-methyltransferase [Salinigranum sp.]